MKYILVLIPIIIFVLITGCKQNQHSSDYIEQIEAWKEERLTNLTAFNGWTTLCGLFWLKVGTNVAGASSDSDVEFPTEMPQQVGYFQLENDSVHFSPAAADIKLNNTYLPLGIPALIFPTQNETILSWNEFQWLIIRRGDRYGVRLRDTLHPNRALSEIPAYTIDEAFNIPATISYRDTTQTIKIQNVLGQVRDRKIVGTLEFSFRGAHYSLTALDGGPDKFYVIFSDETTGFETYGGGRFLYPDKPSSGDKTFVDFNKAYNPPCVFSVYATCPLPPKENHLTFKVEAGERYLDLGLDH